MKIKPIKGQANYITDNLADNIDYQIKKRYLGSQENININVKGQRPEFTCINHLSNYFSAYYLDREHRGIPDENDYFEIPNGTPDAEIAKRAIKEFPFFVVVEE